MRKYISILLIVLVSCESSSDLGLSGIRGETSFSAGSDSNTGIGGSMARFTIVDDYLYTIDSWTLKSYDITDQLNPVYKEDVNLGWGIETIFPYNGNLFIGAQSGMHIYNLDNKESPE